MTEAGRLLTVLALNLIIPTAQVVLGVRAHSVALITRALPAKTLDSKRDSVSYLSTTRIGSP